MARYTLDSSTNLFAAYQITQIMSKQNPAKALPRLVALQHRDFRLIWIGQLISMIGTQMQARTVDWHVAELLKDVSYTVQVFGQPMTIQADALGLGSLGLARVIPIVIFALIGGMLADTFNRR